MSDKFSKIDSFKKDFNLSDQDIVGMLGFYQGQGKYVREIVTIRQFIEWKEYLDAKDVIYPEIMKCLEELNSGQYSEAVLTGSIGSGKSTVAVYTIAYQLYLLSCLKSPQQEFGLDPSSEIVLIFQNLNEKKAKDVDFARFKALIERSPYFQKHFPFNKDTKSELNFPNRIIARPVTGQVSGAIGENVIGGIIDEVNFMEVVDKSKQSAEGGTYNQAEVLYNSLARRRESRFFKGGKLPGILCIVSSKRYPGEFTDKKIEEAQKDPSIYVYDKRVWEVKPKGTFSDATFKVFKGNMARNPRILEDNEKISLEDQHLILDIPVDFKKQFELDIMDALRDIGGISLRSTQPFLIDVERVKQCFGTHPSILSLNSVDFSKQKLRFFGIDKIPNPNLSRFIHADLSLNKDHTGLVMGHVSHFTQMDREDGYTEMLPVIHIDFVLDIIPPPGGEIDFSKIRKLIYMLRDSGTNIRWVSFDSYQSADMIQQLRQKRFKSGVQSMDKTPQPYIFLKNALKDQRVKIPNHNKLYDELISLEWDEKKGKVDHRPQKSKDLADCLAGVVYGLIRQRGVWFEHDVPVIDMIKVAKTLGLQEEVN
ncbi:MAG: hypothetical protein IH886_02595 [Nitrospinae bacterium]|nr:hypothetical protein [Nitrospinota bacterium]